MEAFVSNWLGEEGSNLQVPDPKSGDFTNLSIPDNMAASSGFEPEYSAPEADVLPFRRQGIKHSIPCVRTMFNT